MNISIPRGCEGKIDVVVNNISIGKLGADDSLQATFATMPDGNNTVEFIHLGTKESSGKRSFFACQGAELNVTVWFWWKSGGLFGKSEKGCDVDISTIKHGLMPEIGDSNVLPDLVRRESHREKITGIPGTKYTLNRKRTVERQIVLSESAKLELSATAKAGFGIVDVTAKIKTTLSQKDAVLMRDKEEVNQSVEVVFDTTGTANLVWIDFIKKGRCEYRFNGRSKELEFEVLYSSELSILKE